MSEPTPSSGDLTPKQGHRPNFAAMKGPDGARAIAQPARAPKPQQVPEQTPKQAADYLSASPRRPMTTEQVASYNIAAGRWTEQEGQAYRQQRAAERPEQADRVNAEQSGKAWNHHIKTEATKLTAEDVADRYHATGQQQEQVKFEKTYASRMQDDPSAAEAFRQEAAEKIIRAAAERKDRSPEQQQAQELARRNAPYMRPLAEVEREQQRGWRADLDRRQMQPEPSRREKSPAELARLEVIERGQDAQALSRDQSQDRPKGPKR